MPQKNLFNTEQWLEPLDCDSMRTDPVVWIQKLIILSRPNASAIVRQIQFHRGLNIIRTEKRRTDDTCSVAHDVGKTLLMRLLRYTLGEDWFASKEDAARINAALPHGVVAAEWYIGGQLWAVVRSMSNDNGEQSYAVCGQGWEAAVNSADSDRIPMSAFVERIELAAISELPTLRLKGASVGWQDVLAWIARDCECGFRKLNNWRDSEVNPRGLRDRKFNKLIMQWLMGLMPESEATARYTREENRKLRKDVEKQVLLKQERLQTLFDSLAKSAAFQILQVEESSEQPSLIDRADELRAFVQRETSRTKSNLEEFEKQAAEEIETLRLREKQLEDQKTAAIREAGEWRTRHQMLKRQLQDEERRETGPQKCPAKHECAWLIQIENNDAAGRMASEEDHLTRLKVDIQEAFEKSNDTSSKEERLTGQHRTAQEGLVERRSEATRGIAALQKEAGRWESLASQMGELVKATQEASDADEAAQSIGRQIENDEKQLSTEADDHSRRARLRILQQSYIRILTHVFGDDAYGDVQIDRGLKPTTAATLGAHGTALSAIARVISFELGCVLASMCRLGGHPRLLMHDGPREGEMEAELFRILIRTINWLESVSPKPEASFQYILTTADAPEEYSEGHPSVVLTLHGRNDEGLLLKRRF